MDQAGITVSYDGSYRRIPYPGGDVPESTGVCCDVIVRAYRKIGIDLQVMVHQDMTAHFTDYPQKWGLSAPDSNIDHRRVPNLQTFFRRAGADLPVSQDASAYQPGDLVTWMLPGNLPHIGIITFQKTENSKIPLVVHNIGCGVQIEDILLEFPITGHYRYAVRGHSSVPSD